MILCSTKMRAQTSSRRIRLFLRITLLHWVIAFAAGAAADTGEEFVPATPSNMLAMVAEINQMQCDGVIAAHAIGGAWDLP